MNTRRTFLAMSVAAGLEAGLGSLALADRGSARSWSGKYDTRMLTAHCQPRPCKVSRSGNELIEALRLDGASVDGLILLKSGDGYGLSVSKDLNRDLSRWACLVNVCPDDRVHLALIVKDGEPASDAQYEEVIEKVTQNLRWPDQARDKLMEPEKRIVSIGAIIGRRFEGRKTNTLIPLRSRVEFQAWLVRHFKNTASHFQMV